MPVNPDGGVASAFPPSIATPTAAAPATSAEVVSPTSTALLPNIAASPVIRSCRLPRGRFAQWRGPRRGWHFRSTRAQEHVHRSTDGPVHPCLRMRAEDGPYLGNHLRPFAAAVHATMAGNNENPPLLPIPPRWGKMEFWKYLAERP